MGLLSARRYGALVALLATSGAASAQSYLLTQEDVRPAEGLQFELPDAGALTNPAGMETYRAMAQEIGRQSSQETMEEMRRVGKAIGALPEGETLASQLAAAPGIARLPEGMRASILVSRAMGEGTLRDLLGLYRMRRDVRFVFRGVPAEMTVPQFALWLKQLAEPAPGEAGGQGAGQGEITDLNITIDPGLFDLVGAKVAPTLLLENLQERDPAAGDTMDVGRIVARAEGATDPDALQARLQAGQDALRNPNVVEIEEEDLRQRAEREAGSVAARLTRDPEVLKRRYWDRTRLELKVMHIPPAGADRTRELHFLFRAGAPITDHQGRTLAFAGEVFQPGDVAPFDRRVLVFNPNRESEVAFVDTALQAPRAGVQRTMLIATEVPATQPGQEPWDGLQALIDRFGTQVFLLNENFRTSFGIEASPTEIYPAPQGARVAVMSEEHLLP